MNFVRHSRPLVAALIFTLLPLGAGQQSACARAATTEASTHGHDAEAVKLAPADLARTGIELGTAGAWLIASTLRVPGQLVLNAERSAHIVVPLDSTVRKLPVALGATVKAGAALATLDSRELADLSAAFLSAKARLTLAGVSLKREQTLWEQKISAEQDYLAAQHAHAEAQIEQAQARQKLLAVGLDEPALRSMTQRADGTLAGYELKAPISGTLIAKDVTLGEAVAAGTKLFEVADLSTVWLEMSVFPQDLGALALGQRVQVTSTGQVRSTSGAISYIQALASPGSRAVLVRVVLDNPDGEWRPGLAVTAEIVTAESNVAVVVPRDAVQTYEGRQVVFVEGAAGLTPLPVTIGRGDARQLEVVAGLTAGQRYVVKNSFLVKAELSKGEAAHED